ncbi:hypothetical protein PO909_030664 [Leuciscus waleckii]
MGGYGFDLNGSRRVDQNHNHDTDFLTQPFLILSETPAMGSAIRKSRMFSSPFIRLHQSAVLLTNPVVGQE